MRRRISCLTAILGLIAVAPSHGAEMHRGENTKPPPVSGTMESRLAQIDTIVVLYAENRSFDTLYGNFPGANGLKQARPLPQRDRDGDWRPGAWLTTSSARFATCDK